ncbi:hypothetical protein DNTS_022080, partial [Danionella cerebrum]
SWSSSVSLEMDGQAWWGDGKRAGLSRREREGESKRAKETGGEPHTEPACTVRAGPAGLPVQAQNPDPGPVGEEHFNITANQSVICSSHVKLERFRHQAQLLRTGGWRWRCCRRRRSGTGLWQKKIRTVMSTGRLRAALRLAGDHSTPGPDSWLSFTLQRRLEPFFQSRGCAENRGARAPPLPHQESAPKKRALCSV